MLKYISTHAAAQAGLHAPHDLGHIRPSKPALKKADWAPDLVENRRRRYTGTSGNVRGPRFAVVISLDAAENHAISRVPYFPTTDTPENSWAIAQASAPPQNALHLQRKSPP